MIRAKLLEICYQEALLYLKYVIISQDFCYKLLQFHDDGGDQASSFLHNLDSKTKFW